MWRTTPPEDVIVEVLPPESTAMKNSDKIVATEAHLPDFFNTLEDIYIDIQQDKQVTPLKVVQVATSLSSPKKTNKKWGPT